MIREAICEGIDVEEALEKAKAALGVGDTDEYDFEVLQREEKSASACLADVLQRSEPL